MASRPTTSTHWALCSSGSRWALSSSVRLWILPACWARTHTTGNAWEWGSFPNTDCDWLQGSHLEAVSSHIPVVFFLSWDQRSVVELRRGWGAAFGHVDFKSRCLFHISLHTHDISDVLLTRSQVLSRRPHVFVPPCCSEQQQPWHQQVSQQRPNLIHQQSKYWALTIGGACRL